MASWHDWYKTTLEFIKDNKLLMLLIVSLSGGNIYQAVAPKPVKQTVVKQTGCPVSCINRIEKLEKLHD